MRNFAAMSLFFLFLINGVAIAAENDFFEVETEGSYQMDAEDTVELAKKVSFFIAQRKAVDVAGRYLSHKSFIQAYKLNRDEIYSLAAREIQAEILEEEQERVGKITNYRIRIRANIQASDFVKAEMQDIKQGKIESKESYKAEMEQPIPAKIDPGIDIAKAYRLLREKKWRIAMIYLDHLEKKYPNWDSIYMAKAITHYILNEPVFMKKALSKACQLGNNTACDDLKKIKKLHKTDFGLSVID
jgi:hypothetical protein